MATNLRRINLKRLLTNHHHHITCCTSRDLHVAVIGSGPAGFYLTASLLRQHKEAKVDFFEKQPVPFGLARFGVAPDHPEVKNCMNPFEKLMIDQPNRLRFFGNVAIGSDLTIEQLREHYDAVVCAYGAATDKTMGVPGEFGKNCLSARRFVGWYSGLPEAQDLKINLDVERAVIIGHGNVALDVARILLSPIDRLSITDATEPAIECLRHSRVKHVTLIGRRGPLQIAFTIKELREMINLPGSIPNFDVTGFPQLSPQDIKQLPRPRQRLVDLLMRTAQNPPKKHDIDREKQWALKFMRSPKEVHLDSNGSISALTTTINQFTSPSLDLSNALNAKVQPTDATDDIDCQLLFVSIGYRSVEMPGLPYDKQRNVIKTDDLVRVTGLPGVYATGWCSRGPTGVIASTQHESAGAAKEILDDLNNGTIKSLPDRDQSAIETILNNNNVQWISWHDWLKVDAKEKELGQKYGKPREKLTEIKKILEVAKK